MANGDQPRVRLLRVLDLGEIFAMPLNALIDADVYAAETFVNFVKEFGFERDLGGDSGDGFGKLRMVRFTYRRPMRDGVVHTFHTEIPWLSLVPLPNLSIETADLSFAVDILGCTETAGNGSALAGGAATATGGRLARAARAQRRPPPSQLAGRVRRKPLRHFARLAAAPRAAPIAGGSEASAAGGADVGTVSTQIRCAVKIRRSDLPAGISDLLNLMGQAVEDAEEAATLRLDSDLATLGTSAREATLIATLQAADGRALAGLSIEITADPAGIVSFPLAPYTTNADGKAVGSIVLASPPVEATTVLVRATSTVEAAGRTETVVGTLTLTAEPAPIPPAPKAARRVTGSPR